MDCNNCKTVTRHSLFSQSIPYPSTKIGLSMPFYLQLYYIFQIFSGADVVFLIIVHLILI